MFVCVCLFLAYATANFAVLNVKNTVIMIKNKLFYMECHLAGRQYHDCNEVFGKLEVGTRVKLVRELDNRYDPDAVAVVYENVLEASEVEEVLLGYIPSAHNTDLAAFLEMGWDKIFDCRISRINPEAHYEQQIHLTVKIKRNIAAD